MEPEIRLLQFYNRYVVPGTDLVLSILLVTECEPLARVPDLARGKISLARSIHSCPNFFLFVYCDQRLYIVKNVCIYTHICVQTVYELPLLTNNTAVKHFTQIGSDAKC